MNHAIFIERRKLLLESIKHTYPDKKGVLVLFSGFEDEKKAFRQDSTFYYLTGLEEPACVLVMDESATTLWVPQYGITRSKWVSTIVEADKKEMATWGIDEIKHLGHPCKGYTAPLACTESEYEHLLTGLKALVKQGNVLFMDYPPSRVNQQTLFIDRLFTTKPTLREALVDVSPLIGLSRKTKDQHEMEVMYDAIDCTMQALEAAAGRMEADMFEYQIQAAVEFVFKEGGGSAAFPTIVASGKNSTTLHYTKNTGQLKNGDLVVIDCGAEIGNYCADLSRTFPVSGEFTDRQREVYDVVLNTQQHVADQAQPGYWLNNEEHPEKSLHHIALAYLTEQGYAEYFPHGIGHFLGLDVHDVGSGPLQEGDVITIEPGIYIPQENIGIRIEDNYWITDKGAVCISEELPSDSYEIEMFMKGELGDEDSFELNFEPDA